MASTYKSVVTDRYPAGSVEYRMLEMLDRIHYRIDAEELTVRPGPKDAEANVDGLFNEIGCLIAEAKGEYDPAADANGPDAQDHNYNRGPM